MIPRWLLTVLVMALCCARADADERRVALVVGVGAYAHAPRLANTQNDARAVTAALKTLNFEVEELLDPDRAALENGVRSLGQRARGADAALFYYAGHALELNGRNWLLPASADIQRDRDLRFEALDLDSILEQVEGAARVALLFLDSCRDNPFRMRLTAVSREAPLRGLARITSGYGTFVAFATAPGTIAQDGNTPNSPFTAALLKRIDTPGLELRRLMSLVRADVRETTKGRQVPWDNSALDGDFYFRPAAAAPAAGAAPPLDREAVFWSSISASRDPEDFRAYLAQFPQGTFAALARNRLAQLQAAAATSPPGAVKPPAVRAAPDKPVSPSAPAPPSVPADSASPWRQALLTRLAAVAPEQSAQLREHAARSYERMRAPKALAAIPGSSKTWRMTEFASAENAEERVLEACQVQYGAPCTLIALNDTLQPVPANGAWPRRNMPRTSYAHHFTPDQIPAVRNDVLRREDVKNYRSAPGAKAAALHAWGHLFVVTGAATVREAAERALAACNAEPFRNGADGACYIYALGNKVVLPQRLTQPPQPATTLEQAFALVATGSNALQNYLAESDNKAQAVEPDSGKGFRWTHDKSKEGAERAALEACQIRYAQPCILLATNNEVKAGNPPDAPRHDMERVRYEGRFRLDMVPMTWSAKARELLASYASAKQHRAIAMRAGPPKLFVASGHASAREAEKAALQGCAGNDEYAYPCILYAVDDQVILRQRRTEARK